MFASTCMCVSVCARAYVCVCGFIQILVITGDFHDFFVFFCGLCACFGGCCVLWCVCICVWRCVCGCVCVCWCVCVCVCVCVCECVHVCVIVCVCVCVRHSD